MLICPSSRASWRRHDLYQERLPRSKSCWHLFVQISSLLSWSNVYLFTKWPRFIWGSAEDNFKTIEERFYWRSIIIVKYYQFPPSLFASFSSKRSITFAFLKIEIKQMTIGWLLSHLFIKVYKSSVSTFVMWTIWFMNGSSLCDQE